MTAPDPLVPAEVDLRGLEWMPLYGARLFGSDFDAHADDTAFRCGLQLWWSAWNQVPAASLPDDDVALCRLAGLGRDAKAWKRVKSAALRGFIMCSDGRLYHRQLAGWALQAWDRRRRERDRKAKWRASQERTPEQGQRRGRDAGHTTGQDASGDGSGTRERRGEERRGDSKKEDTPPAAAASPVAPREAAAAAAPPDPEDDLEIPERLDRRRPPSQAAMAERALVDEAYQLWLTAAYELGISDVGHLNRDRRTALAARISEVGGIEGWRAFIAKVREAEFLRDDNGRPKFWVGLAKLLEPEHFSKVLEGRYAERHERQSQVQPSRSPEAVGVDAAFARRYVQPGS